MRLSLWPGLVMLLFVATRNLTAVDAPPASTEQAAMLRRIYDEALVRGQAFENLRALVTESPGRLAGSKSLEHAVTWGERTLNALSLDRVFKQDVMVPHWERGAKESVIVVSGAGTEPLTAVALGGSGSTPATGIVAEVTEVKSLDEVIT